MQQFTYRHLKSMYRSKNNMVKPVIMTVDDEPQVLNAIYRDLRPYYGERYRNSESR